MDTVVFSMFLLHTAMGSAGAQYTPGECLRSTFSAERAKVYAGVAVNACAPLCVARARLRHSRSCMCPDGHVCVCVGMICAGFVRENARVHRYIGVKVLNCPPGISLLTENCLSFATQHKLESPQMLQELDHNLFGI